MEVACWHTLHFARARQAIVSVIRVTRHAADTKRDPKVSWFVFRGQTRPPLPALSPLYGRRYSAAHGYRVDKQDWLWETPRLRTPEQFQHWAVSSESDYCINFPIHNKCACWPRTTISSASQN
jgi:hypothetical protein